MSRMLFVLGLLWVSVHHVRAADPDAALLRTAASLYEGIRTETLPNGLRVFLKPIPGSPVVTTMTAYKVGGADEELDQTGLSHYLEHLMFKGTDKLLPGDIDRLTQRNGGMNNAYTSEDMTVYHFDFAADRWMTALEIEADRMRNLKIDKKHEFEQEKGAVIAELNRNEDTPWDLEYKLILPLLFSPKSPYGHSVIGERAHVEGATAEIIKRHYDRWYHPNNAAIIVVGGFDEKEAMTKIRKLFGDIPRVELPQRKEPPKVEPRKETIRKKMMSKFETPKLLMGFNTVTIGHADEIPFDLLSYVLATGKTSRLYRKLVDGEKLAVSVGASNNAGRLPGWFEIQAELLKNDLEKVEGIITAEVKKIAEEGVTEAEMKRVKRALLASYIFGREGVHDLANSIASSAMNSDLDYLKTYLAKVAAITNDDLKRVAKKYLVDAKGVVVWSVPEEEKKGALPTRSLPSQQPARGKFRFAAEGPKSGSAYSLADMKTVTLPNGLKLLLMENHRLPMVVVEAQVNYIRMLEPETKLGVSALTSLLMEEGTTTRTSEQIAQAIEDTGGSMSLSSGGGSLKVLTPDTETGLDLFFDCLMNPTFPQDALDSRREQLLSQIGESEKQPAARASREFRALVYGKHPYGRPSSGTTASVKKLTAKDCKDFHTMLVRPNNTVLAVVGDFDADKLIAGIKKRTEKWERKDIPPLPKIEVVRQEKFYQKIITDADAAQLHIFLGHVGITRKHPDYYKLLVMDNVLGTGPGFTDRLSSTLRDRQGLAYTVNATIASSAGEQPGTFQGYIGTFPDKYTWVKDGFLKEIKRIREEVPSKEEVEDAKKYLTGSLAFRMTTAEQAASMMLTVDYYGLGVNYLDDYRKAVSSVTPEEVREVAKQHLDPERMIFIAVGAIDQEGKAVNKKEPK